MARNISSDHLHKSSEFYPMISGGNGKIEPTKLAHEERSKSLEEMLRDCEQKTAGPEEATCTPPKGPVVAERLLSEGPMLKEPTSKEEATAKEPTLMESLIELSTAIQENERLTTRSEQLCSPKKESAPKEKPASNGSTGKDLTPKKSVPMDLLIDLSAEGIATHDWVKAGPNQLSNTPKEPTPKESTPIDLLVELSAEERAGTLHSVIRKQDWQVPIEPGRKAPTRKEPAPNVPVRIEPARKEPPRNELTRRGPVPKGYAPNGPARKEPAPKEPTRNEPTRKEPTRNEPTRNEPTRNEPTRNEPTRNEPTRKGPAAKAPTRKEPTRREPTRKEPTRTEPARKEPTRKEPTFKEPAFTESTPMGTLIDLSNVPRNKVAPLPPMLHGIRHLLGIQRTYEKAVPVFSAIPALVPAKKYDYLSPTSVLAKQPGPKHSSTPAPPHMRNQSSTPPPHMRILSMAEGAATPPHMRTPSENSSLTRSLSPVSSSSRSPSIAPVITEPAKPALDQSGRYLLTWEDEVPDYLWVEGAEGGEEREW